MYLALHPASHSCAIDSSDRDVSASTMCTRRALAGSVGSRSSASCVDCMMLPLGFRIWMGFRVGRKLHVGMTVVKKWPVAPVSAQASMIVWLVGAPE